MAASAFIPFVATVAVSSWLARENDLESADLPSHLRRGTHVHLQAPASDMLAEGYRAPGSASTTFSFREAWESSRSLDQLHPRYHRCWHRWDSRLRSLGLSMDAGTRRARSNSPRRAPDPTASIAVPAKVATWEDFVLAQRHIRHRRHAILYRRLGLVRGPDGRFARHPDSAWTSHAGLDRRVRWSPA